MNQTDYNIVLAANGTIPGQVGWDLAADIWPETVTGPYTADNIVDNNDLNLVKANMNKTGQFYERTMYTPDFYEVEEEVEKSEDVILVIRFWYNPSPEEWIPAEYPDTPYDQPGLGHAVTVAGINSSALQIAISDPGIDAFEAGSTPGRSPVNHTHMPPEPPYTMHNNASLVSHDIYNVTLLPPGAPGLWALQGYGGVPGAPPGTVAVVEAAVIVSPLEVLPPPPPVGGIRIPVDKLGLLAPYIAFASTILVAATSAAIYVKRVKRRKKKQ